MAERQDIEARIEALLAQMTLAEKVLLCHAGSKFAVTPLERLGIPEFGMSDGPHGVRQEISRDSWDPAGWTTDFATYLPTGTALAASWDVEAARRFGEVLGAEARERRKDIILGPGINIIRSPLCGRNFEYYSEDPCLVARMVVPVIQGIQSQDVAACAKHYAANSQELNRFGVDARMDERTLREIYLPGFRAAVVEGGCLTVMGAYNKFRGQHCCHHEHLVNDILKDEWGFDGSFISDWAGAHDTLEAAQYGLDLEMGTNLPYDDYYLARPFRAALERGELPLALVDDKVRRNLRVMFRVGLFDPQRRPGARGTPAHRRTARDLAAGAMVLLKNEGGVLPLDRARLKRLVVVGDNATVVHAIGGNSSGVKTDYEVTPLQGLQEKLGQDVEIRFFRGYPGDREAFAAIPGQYLGIADQAAGTNGWQGSYFDNRRGEGQPRRRADPDLDFDWSETAPFPGFQPKEYHVRWESTLTVPQSGSYEFMLDGVEHAGLWIDGKSVIQRWDSGGPDRMSQAIALEAGRSYRIGVHCLPHHPRVRVKLAWLPPWAPQPGRNAEEETLRQAVTAADAVIFVGGLNHQYDVEGGDRHDMDLHDGQNELIAKLAAWHPRLAVVLVGGSPVAMPWADQVPAIVQMWYAGMEGGHALADILCGDVNPSGKLPMTFPRTLADSPGHALGDYQADYCLYKEGIFVGYRWFDAQSIEPLFSFGHGLSYTRFAYSGLSLEARPGECWQVRFQLANGGPVAGAEVAQLYLRDDECSVPRPPQELKAFAKVFLAPGESREVAFELTSQDLCFYSNAARDWVAEPGRFTVLIGSSSRDLRLQGSFQLA